MTLSQYLEQLGRGGKVQLAEKLNLTPQAVGNWVLKGKQISVETAVQIYFVTKGQVSLYEMRPDVFPAGYVLVHVDDVKKSKRNV